MRMIRDKSVIHTYKHTYTHTLIHTYTQVIEGALAQFGLSIAPLKHPDMAEARRNIAFVFPTHSHT
jgi:lauroyl/myristoyl acyltransferase